MVESEVLEFYNPRRFESAHEEAFGFSFCSFNCGVDCKYDLGHFSVLYSFFSRGMLSMILMCKNC